MKPLENRAWFVVLTLILATVIMFGLWESAGLVVSPHVGAIFLFSILGLWNALHKMLALLFIKLSPSLGRVG